jgi:small subunit ribosomal protein S1
VCLVHTKKEHRYQEVKEDKRAEPDSPSSSSKRDLSSLGSMLQARWKSGAAAGETKPEAARSGQIRKFRIAKLEPATKKIELELA